MLPLDLEFLQELAGQALENIAQALATASGEQRSLLLDAMNALDDIEALVGTATEISAVALPTSGRALPTLSLPPLTLGAPRASSLAA